MQDEALEGIRLSPQQKQIWLLAQPYKSAAYLAQCTILLEGNLEVGTLKKSLNLLVERHSVLRTTFHDMGGITLPIQVVTQNSAIDWREIDLREEGAEEGLDATIDDLVRQENSFQFDLQRGPMLRPSLFRLSDDRHILILTLPALCADAKTLANLGDELCDTYTAIIHDEEPGKPNEDEGVEYIQIAEWQNELVEDDGPERRYWLEGNFSEFIELKLPFEDNRFDDRPFEADSLPITVSKITVDRVSG